MKKVIFLICFFIAGSAFAQWTMVRGNYSLEDKKPYSIKGDSAAYHVLLFDGSGTMATDTSAWTYEDTTLTLTTVAKQLSVLLTRTKLIGDIVIQNAPASTVNIVGGWTSEASLVVFPSGSLHYDFLGNPKRFYLKSESGTPSVNISYKYKP